MSVQQKNWTDLPDDIKRTIFDFNRTDAEINRNKKRYEMVVGDIKAQLDHLECNTYTDHDEYGREIDEIIRPRDVLKQKQCYQDDPEGFFHFYHGHYYPHINYDEFVVRFRQAIQ